MEDRLVNTTVNQHDKECLLLRRMHILPPHSWPPTPCFPRLYAESSSLPPLMLFIVIVSARLPVL